jgi:pantothenate kinase
MSIRFLLDTFKAAEQFCIQNSYKVIESLVITEGLNLLKNPDRLSTLMEFAGDIYFDHQTTLNTNHDQQKIFLITTHV